jgi:methylated-DNA-[protein]-cysteine S-methyltransferase
VAARGGKGANDMTWHAHPSPIGALTLVSDGAALSGCYFEMKNRPAPVSGRPGADRVIDAARRQLDAYFAGKQTSFDLPLAPRGTPFQLQVWQALRAIPYGETTSYGMIAQRIGLPKASRAVGAANGANPIPIIVPCHRVIGASGALTGFGGGLDRKRFLLALERGPDLLAERLTI